MNRFTLLFLFVFVISLAVKAQNFTGGFNFNLPYDDSTSVDFLPKFPKTAIAEADFVSADNFGNFVRNGEPIRFFGGNLTTQGAFPTHADAEKIAGRMRKMGINLIRFHHIDNPWSNGSLFYGITGTRKFNATLLDRLDYLIFQLKENGIFVDMNLNVSRTFQKSDGVFAADSLSDYAKGITLFNRHMIDLEKEYAEQLLGHVNPYTGNSLAQDPVLAMVEIVNENSLFRRWYGNDLTPISKGGTLPTFYSNELDSLWRDFLKVKYDSTANVAFAWNSSKKTGDTIFTENFEKGLNTQIWQMEKHEGADATFKLSKDADNNNAVLVETIKNGTESWHITFKNVGLTVQKDSVYELYFRAKANASTKMAVGFQRDNSPWTYYSGTTVDCTTNYKQFKVVFKAPENNSKQLRIAFRFEFYLGQFYIDDVVFKKASTFGLEENESFENENIRRLAFSEVNNFAQQRVSDLTEFYAQTQISFLKEMKTWLKDSLGVKAPLAGTNWYVGPEDVYVQNTLDYLDNHAYWDHPQFPNIPWSSTDWKINNIPMMAAGSSTIENLFNGLNVKNKPYTVSEYNHGYPNQFQAEMLPMITSYLAFNGADGIMFFTYSGTWDWSVDKLDGYFDLHRNNSVMAGFPVFSYVFRNNYIREAQNVTSVNFRKSDILKMPLQVENSWGTHTPFPKELSYTNKVELTFNEDEPSDISQVPSPTASPFSLNNNEIYWDKNGIFKINAPKFNSISGQLGQNSGAATDQMKLESGSDFGSVSWLSLVDSTLSESSKSVLFFGSKQINTGMIWDGTNTIHNNWGRNPTLISPLSVSVKLKNKAEGLKVIPLDKRGNPVLSRVKYFVTDENGYSTVELNTAADATVWYGIETVADWSITKNNDLKSSENLIRCFPNPSSNAVRVKQISQVNENFELLVYDFTGKLVNSQKSKSEYQLNRHELGSGMFFYKAIFSGEVISGVFIFQ